MPRLQTAFACLAALLLHAAAWAQDEVPFITTPDRVTLAMLELAEVKPGDHVIDLGSGDGRIVITAAKRFGATGLGVEIDPALVQRSRDNARKAGVAAAVRFEEQDLFLTALQPATVITVYLLPSFNLQLRERLLKLAPGTRIVSHDWDMGEWQPERSLSLEVPEKAIGREKKSTLHLWRVPAAVHGVWCSRLKELRLTQRFQQFSLSLHTRGQSTPGPVFDGRIHGASLSAEGAFGRLNLQFEPGRLRVAEVAVTTASLLKGEVFSAAPAGGCS